MPPHVKQFHGGILDCIRWLPCIFVLTWWFYEMTLLWASAPRYRFGALFVCLAVFLVWKRWSTRPRTDTRAPLWICIALAGISIPFLLAASQHNNEVRFSFASNVALAVGCALYLSVSILCFAGRKTLRHFLFSLLALLLAAPWPLFFEKQR